MENTEFKVGDKVNYKMHGKIESDSICTVIKVGKRIKIKEELSWGGTICTWVSPKNLTKEAA